MVVNSSSCSSRMARILPLKKVHKNGVQKDPGI